MLEGRNFFYKYIGFQKHEFLGIWSELSMLEGRNFFYKYIDFQKYEFLGIWSELSLLEGRNFFYKYIDFQKYEFLGIWSEQSLLEGRNFFDKTSFDENGFKLENLFNLKTQRRVVQHNVKSQMTLSINCFLVLMMKSQNNITKCD